MTLREADIDVCTTYYNPDGCYDSSLSLSAMDLGIEIHNFGFKDGFDTFAKTKLVALLEFAKKSKASMILFLDGNDTMLLDSPADVVATWKELCEDKVAIGSERKCWPHPHLEKKMKSLQVEAGGKRFAFLDTGFILGKRDEVIAMLETVLASIPKWREAMPDLSLQILEDDVGLFALNICDGSISPFIDYEARFILPMKSFGVSLVSIEGDDVCVRGFENRPHVLHCNGGRFRDRVKLEQLTLLLFGNSTKKKEKERNV